MITPEIIKQLRELSTSWNCGNITPQELVGLADQLPELLNEVERLREKLKILDECHGRHEIARLKQQLEEANNLIIKLRIVIDKDTDELESAYNKLSLYKLALNKACEQRDKEISARFGEVEGDFITDLNNKEIQSIINEQDKGEGAE